MRSQFVVLRRSLRCADSISAFGCFLLSTSTFAAIALAQHPSVSECFKVRELLRADEEHYWATWTNGCPYTIDAVYVMVRFADRSSREIADGVWSLHFIPPGTHRTMRFSAPGKIADFASVRQQKITADMGEAFGREMAPAKPALSSIELAAEKGPFPLFEREAYLAQPNVAALSLENFIDEIAEACQARVDQREAEFARYHFYSRTTG